MAIGFARLEFVQRSAGKNACAKSAYNSRSIIEYAGNSTESEKTYNWSFKEKPAFHEILLPSHVDIKFKNVETLWNAVEQKEVRKNSVTAQELLLALPDDLVISLEDKIDLTKSFINEHFVKKGLVAQIDIHSPEKKDVKTKEEMGVEESNHNWHAHVLLTTRRFKDNGIEFEDSKARDLVPSLRGGKVIAGPNWGKLWINHQNLFFEEKGYDLRVDANGLVSQKHLGPVRMRARAFSLLEENNNLIMLNQLEAENPLNILNKLSESMSVFTREDVERFIQKHVMAESIETVRNDFWQLKDLVQLLDAQHGKPLNKFTSKQVLEEEAKILRLSDSIHKKSAFKVKLHRAFYEGLNHEQSNAVTEIINGPRLSVIEGLAGTGKSYLLNAVKNIYQNEGYTVRAFGPDNATVNTLKEKGFVSAENVYKFLFALHHDKRAINKAKEVWIVDEAGKLGNRPLLELLKEAKRYDVQVIFSGDSSQLQSVERGGLFKVFSQKYGAQFLHDIQRQKQENQRDIARNLAHGNMAVAIDNIVKHGGLKWEINKNAAIESLIKKWSLDQSAFPNSSTLIIAHTNSEMRALNEMARLYRRQKGELAEQEFMCETVNGKTYVSVGDKIEFRKNDQELGITNGMTGILIKASPAEFVVQVKENDKSKDIIFNPSKHSSFQLGYATTFYRSQGRTIDRAYVLHSPQMNKEMFYVGLTRHVHRAYLFISREEIKNVSDLKKQAFKRNLKFTTLGFTTQEQIDRQKGVIERNQKLQELKASPLLLNKIKGYTATTWHNISSKFDHLIQNIQDHRSNEQFFNPNLTHSSEIAKVVEVAPLQNETNMEPKAEFSKNNFVQTINPEKVLSETGVKNESATKEAWVTLSEKNRQLLRKYYESMDRASNLYAIVEAESEGIKAKEKESSHFNEWQEACGIRNEKAHDVCKFIPKGHLGKLFSKEGLMILQERSCRFEKNLSNKEGLNDLERNLKENIESLTYQLFPEGPTRRDRQALRFGSKGSLVVTCQGKHAGCYHDFERNEGGGPLKLIQRVLNIDAAEATLWAKNFMGEEKNKFIPTQKFSSRFSNDEKLGKWVCLSTDPKKPAPSLQALAPKLCIQYAEAARYEYRAKDGTPLFYTLRLVEKSNPTKKIVLPLTYGYWKGSEGNPSWSLKGWDADKKPLYNLQQLSNHPGTVLIVEGEKTADAAAKLLAKDNILCITWSGGAGAVSKTDWTELYGRQVIIWPDNDNPGFKAAEDICSELRKVGVKSLKVVDTEVLAKEFSPKWDLADPLPSEKSLSSVRDLLLNAREKAVSIDFLVSSLKDKSLIAKLRAKEILWRVDQRMRSELEKTHGGRVWNVQEKIAQETLRILNGKESIETYLKTELAFPKSLAEKASYQIMIQEAQKGKTLADTEIQEIKYSIFALGAHQELFKPNDLQNENRKLKDEIYAFSFDQGVINLIERKGEISHQLLSFLQKEAQDFSKRISTVISQDTEDLKSFQNLQERNRQLETDL